MQKKEEHMGKHKALQGAIAAFASVAALGALAVPALADERIHLQSERQVRGRTGPAWRRTTHRSHRQQVNAKNVVLFIGDGMGDSEITVARDYLKGVKRPLRRP